MQNSDSQISEAIAQGDVNIQAGGVARNHADALQRLGLKSQLITVIGDDNLGVLLKQLCSHMVIFWYGHDMMKFCVIHKGFKWV